MTKQEQQKLACDLSALSLFRGLLDQKPMRALLAYLKCDKQKTEKMTHYGAFVHSLAEWAYSFSDYLAQAVYADENPYVIRTARRLPISDAIRANAAAELALLSSLTQLNAEQLAGGYEDGYLPQFDNTPIDFTQTYAERLARIDRCGYGIFAVAKMFRVADNTIVPVEAADEIALDRFVGYEDERRKVFDNTRALIDGRPAANVLLFGDAGTGKSSTVKACANHFADEGVRLIELRKDQLFSLSAIMGQIAGNPLKFIIFIDDLSFNKNDDCFSMLKAALEGSASAKAPNAVIYATSNRRHIVKETFSDRATSDDIHHNDTVQELMSLSDRFGLCVYFEKPSKPLYLEIVHRLAEKNGITLAQSELDQRAEAFALAKGSRSPRAAEQFIHSLI